MSGTRLVLAILVSSLSASAGDFSTSARGTTAASFLKLAVDARALGMGEAQAAVTDDANALYWNPAGLTRIQRRSASVSHAEHVTNAMFFDYLAFAHRIAASNACGAAFQYFSSGSIIETDPAGAEVGSFTPHDLAATIGCGQLLPAGLGRHLAGAAFGLNVKYVRSAILAAAETAAVDIGFLSPRYLQDRLMFAFTATNFGGSMKFEAEDEPLPMALRVGSALRLREGTTAAMDVVTPRDNDPYVGIGLEHVLYLGNPWRLLARSGFNSRNMGDVEGLSGLSFGFGLGLSATKIDYAILPMGGLGLSHRLSGTIKF